jgi:hypothetical protein
LPVQRLNPTVGPAVNAALHKALAKNPAERHESCVEFINALATACNATPGWMPLPRGASHNMPTVGSQEGLVTTADEPRVTLDETVADPTPLAATVADAPALAPPNLDLKIEPAPERRLPHRQPSHALRNLALAALGAGVVGGGLFIGYQKAKQASTIPAATAVPVEQTVPSAPVSTPPASDKPAAETQPTAAPQPPPPAPESPAPAPTPSRSASSESAPSQDQPARAADTPTPRRTASQQPPVASTSTFQVTTSPAGADVVFDNNGETKCVSPCTQELATGRHTFVVRRSGYREAQKIIEIPRDTGLIVDLQRMMGTLSVVSNPPGLSITIDGQEQAKKTPNSIVLPVGEHRVQVTKGNDKQEFTVMIGDGQLSSKFIEWQ